MVEDAQTPEYGFRGSCPKDRAIRHYEGIAKVQKGK